MSNEDLETKPASFVALTKKQFAGALIAGAITGLLIWGIAFLLDAYVLKAIFCQGTMTDQCTNTFQYASIIGSLIGSAIGVFLLVKLQVFRPLLIGLSVMIALWGMASSLTFSSVQLAALMFFVLYAIAYGLFAWVSRIRLFGMAAVVTVVLVVAVRFVLNS